MEDPYRDKPIVDTGHLYLGPGQRAPEEEPAFTGGFMRKAANRPEPLMVTRAFRRVTDAEYLAGLIKRVTRKVVGNEYLMALVGVVSIIGLLLLSFLL